MEYFDVIIVGAGPAGLNCAKTLGGKKLKVLVLEKNKKIGTKVCAGGIGDKDKKYLKLPNKLIDFSSNEIIIHTGSKNHRIKSKKNFIYTVDREKLGQWQLKKLKKYKNIKIKTNARVSEIARNHIKVNKKKINYKYLVGADGSSSIVKSYLEIASKKAGIAIQYLVPEKKDKLEFFLNPKLSSWYSWVFPHKNKTSIGTGSNPEFYSPKNMVKNFDKWIKKKKISISKSKRQIGVINYDYQGYDFNKIFLIGDAGGFASGFTGKGIYPALITGEEVAKIILNKNHKPKKIKKILRNKRKQEAILRFLMKSGKYRSFVFNTGLSLLKLPFLRRRAIKLFS